MINNWKRKGQTCKSGLFLQPCDISCSWLKNEALKLMLQDNNKNYNCKISKNKSENLLFTGNILLEINILAASFGRKKNHRYAVINKRLIQKLKLTQTNFGKMHILCVSLGPTSTTFSIELINNAPLNFCSIVVGSCLIFFFFWVHFLVSFYFLGWKTVKWR